MQILVASQFLLETQSVHSKMCFTNYEWNVRISGTRKIISSPAQSAQNYIWGR